MLNNYYVWSTFGFRLKRSDKPVLLFLLFIFSFTYTYAQENLVPNGSFEEYWECPTAPDNGDGQLEKCKYWYKPNGATTDYFNACAPSLSGASVPQNWVGSQNAFDGEGYVGIHVYPKYCNSCAEYVQVRLKERLKPCQTYYFSMRVSLSDFSVFKSSGLGIRLDEEPILNTATTFEQYYGFELPPTISMPQTISDTSSWVLFSGIYSATGMEEYLTVGRFFDTSIYSNINPPFEYTGCDTCFWLDSIAYYYIDSVQLIQMETENSNMEETPNVLTANKDGVNDIWYPTNICFEDWKCEIFNRWGNLVYEFSETDMGWSGKDQKNSTLIEGVYFYKVYNETKQQTGYIHLIR